MSAPKTESGKSGGRHKRRTARAANTRKRESEKSPLETILAQSAEAQDAWSRQVFQDGLVDAFREISAGFSLDRVIADPELNAALAEICKAKGLPGDIRWWNFHLFRARKAGKLAEIPTSRRTDLSWKDCDAFLFASEIAWKTMLDGGWKSLDEILCDPEAAAEFDGLAGALCPGHKPLEYRWAALKLRKESKRARVRAGILLKNQHAFREPFLDPLPLSTRTGRRAPRGAGVYLIVNEDSRQPLYVGECLNLRDRLTSQFGTQPLKFWHKTWSADLSVQYFTADADVPLLLAYQSLCVRKRRPSLNIIEPAKK